MEHHHASAANQMHSLGAPPPQHQDLSAIAAFNQSFATASPGAAAIAAAAVPLPTNNGTNEWGKRPPDPDDATDPLDAGSSASKRQHLDSEVVNEHADVFLATAGAAFGGDKQAQQNQQQQQQQQDQDPQDPQDEDENMEDEDDADDDPDYHDDGEDEDEDEAGRGRRFKASQYTPVAAQPPQPLNLMDPSSFALWDAAQMLRIQSLPILDNLSSQILSTLGKGPYQETLNIVTLPDSGQGQAYNTMKSLFDQTKKLYTHEAFLSADELKLDRPEQRATIRKVNLATFVSSVFGSQEVGFFHLNEHFLDTFVPDGGRLLKSQGALYLDLKTQAYISAMSTNERAKEEILEDLFPDNMQDILFTRRPGTKQLTPSEQDFVSRLKQRRAHLRDFNGPVPLSEKYVWQEFLKEVSMYVSKNYESIVAQPTEIKPRKRRSSGGAAGRPMGSQPMAPGMGLPHESSAVDAATAAALMAHNAAQAQRRQTPQPGSSATPDPAQAQLDEELFGPNPHHTYNMGLPPPAAPQIPQQSAPTAVLYERARLAATSKSSPNARRAGLPSQRRPWSSEEENALMAGLDRVKGPHWSQILAMFGPGGTVSEALKDRNQVQLKDKARNLKLFFLKSGIEVPYYLQFVTGELKTRAPGQAAKNAAKKAVEESAAEDAAHVAAVTALGNVHRGNSGSSSQGMDHLDMLQRSREQAAQLGDSQQPQLQQLQQPQQEGDADADGVVENELASGADGEQNHSAAQQQQQQQQQPLPVDPSITASVAPVAQMGPIPPPPQPDELQQAPQALMEVDPALSAAGMADADGETEGVPGAEGAQDAAAAAGGANAENGAGVGGHQVSAERGT